MKTILITLALALTTTAASATDCKRQGGGYMCPGNVYVDGSKASSSAEAAAIALAKQAQEQEQSQSQSSQNYNVNEGNSVNIEGAPKFTASVGIGLNVNLPIASGVQAQIAREAADWYMANGDSCTAFMIMDDSPRVRNLKIKRNCGDRG